MAPAPMKTAVLGEEMSLREFQYPSIPSLPSHFALHSVSERAADSTGTTNGAVGKEVHVVNTLDGVLNDAEVELVVVCVQNHLHFEYAKRCLESGKHVLLEDPVTVHSSQSLELIGLAKSKNLILTSYHNRKQDPEFLAHRIGMKSGKVGDMHTIDQALALCGIPERVTGLSWNARNGGQEGMDDTFNVNLHYPASHPLSTPQPLTMTLRCSSILTQDPLSPSTSSPQRSQSQQQQRIRGTTSYAAYQHHKRTSTLQSMVSDPLSPLSDTSTQEQVQNNSVFFVQAQHDFLSEDGSALSFVQGDVIEVLTQLDSGWWDGLIGASRRGWFPSNYVRRMEDEEAEEWFARMEEFEKAQEFDDETMEGYGPGDRTIVSPSEDAHVNGYHREDGTHRHSIGYHSQNTEQPDTSWLESQLANSPTSESEPDIIDMNPTLDSLAREMMEHDSEQGDLPYQRHEEQGLSPPRMMGDDRPKSGNAADFWVPSLSEDGQIFYLNTKTGEQSYDMPQLDDALSMEGSPSNTRPNNADGGSSSRANPSPLAYGASGSPGILRIPVRSSSAGVLHTDYPESTVTDDSGVNLMTNHRNNQSGFASYARKGGEVPFPWIARMMDDGSGYIYVNRQTGVETEDYNAIMKGASAKEEDTADNATEALKAFGISSNGMVGSIGKASLMKRSNSAASRKSISGLSMTQSESSGTDSPRLRPHYYSNPTRPPSGLKRLSTTDSTHSTNSVPALWERETLDRMETETARHQASTRTIEDYQSTVMRRLNDVIGAAELYILACASGSQSEDDDFPHSHLREDRARRILAEQETAQSLNDAVRATIPAVRNLIHASRHAVLGLQQEVLDSIPRGDQKLQARARSYLSPEALHPSQRRVIAALSKIVFFCHSAVGMDWPFPGSAERLSTDAKELQRSVAGYVNEVRKVGCLAVIPGSDSVRGLKVVVGHLELGQEGLIDRNGQLVRQRAWKKFNEAAVDSFRQDISDHLSGLQSLVRQEDESVVDLYESMAKWMSSLEDFDIAMGLDLDGPTLRPKYTSSSDAYENYLSSVRTASSGFQDFETHVKELQDCSTLFLLQLMSGLTIEGLAQVLNEIRSHLHDLDTIVSALWAVSKSQTALTEQYGIKGKLGKRSARVAERERLAKSVRSHSRHSSLNSSSSPILDVSMQRTRALNGVQPIAERQSRESINSLVNQSSPGRSQLSLAQLSASRRGSSRSSTSGASTDHVETESLSNSIRQSTANFMGRVPFLRTRSTSDANLLNNGRSAASPYIPQAGKSKTKLQKLLGEQDLDRAFVQPSASPGPAGPEIPDYLEVKYPENEIIINADGSIKAGSLVALIQRLTLHESMDSAFNATFLMTYRSFATGEEVFNLLCKRYTMAPPSDLDDVEIVDWQERKLKPVKLRVFNTFKTWVDQHYIESSDGKILELIKDFALNTMANDPVVRMPVPPLIKAVQRRQTDGDAALRKMVSTIQMPPTPQIPKIPSGRTLHLLDITPIELARQMTILESQLYAKIRPLDCLNKAWSVGDNPDSGPNIRAMILNSNRVAGWVTETILGYSDVKKRAIVLKHWIQTADHCRILNNFSTMMAILAGLVSVPIARLKRTRELLNNKTLIQFEELDKIMESGRNFAAYREELKKLDPPCTPFLGVYLTFLTFAQDGNPDFVTSPQHPDLPLIHFFKRQKIAEIIREIQQYQNIPYALSPIGPVIKYIESALASVEGAPDLYELSVKLEPKEREDEKLARMLRESGMI